MYGPTYDIEDFDFKIYCETKINLGLFPMVSTGVQWQPRGMDWRMGLVSPSLDHGWA